MPSNPIFSDTDTSFINDSAKHYVDDPFVSRHKAKATQTGSIKLKPSEWVHEFIRIKDGDKGTVKKIDFGERRYLKRIYDTPANKILLMTSRQTEKSTTLGNKLMALSGMNTMYTSLFVTPSAMQTKVFSTSRIDDIIELSPLIQSLTNKALTYNLLEKEFLTKSKIYLRYAFLSADRIRGLSNNSVFIDEIQDILQDVLPVIVETASHFKHPLYAYSGTPKTLDNTIEQLWSKQSTQTEWCIPCEHHGTPNRPGTWHWVILGIKNLGLKGPICEKCGNALNPEHPQAQWVEMRAGAEFEGYRICRLMVPWFWKPDMGEPDPHAKWKTILHAHKSYPTAQFMNEVMALSHDSGTKPITRIEILNASDSTDTYRMEEHQLAELAQSHHLFGGIDWGPGENSYTVLTIGGYVRSDSNYQILFSRRYDGHMVEPEPQMKDIFRMIDMCKLQMVGVDYGMGFHPNKALTSKYGPKRIHQFQYASRFTHKIKYRGAMGRYIVFRSPVMADIFMAIKTGKVRLPAYSVYNDPYVSDIESIYAEYSDTQRMLVYNKPRGKTDDTFHSILYCVLASFLMYQRPDIIAPIQEPERGGEAAWRAAEDAAISELEDHAYIDL